MEELNYKVYSTKTNKLYDTVAELVEAERIYDETIAAEKREKEERKARAKEVEDAYTNYLKLLQAFVDDYGKFVSNEKTVVKNKNTNQPASIFDVIEGYFFR